MELKNYQKKVITDIAAYMDLLNETGDMNKAYQRFWEEKGIPVASGKIPPYQNILPGVPNLCLKVPTGGGKTFLACNAIKPIFDGLPSTKTKVAVWLVPSDSILSQTMNALKSSSHPYRQKINADFNSRVEVYSKDELLNGQNFNITAVSEQLSIMVLSYDSFRGRKDALKAKQENSNLAPMAKALGTPQNPIEDADETALIQIINQLSPLVIVDESHHARSNLSKEMLMNFNPCFVLDLTATPTKDSNVLCYVDAVQLKRENMVKLPVIVYNRNSMQDVMVDAIDLRAKLEQQAIDEREVSGHYVRPIVLFQAQPKGKEDSATFEKLKAKLVEVGIPEEQIAIKTADVNELKNVDLLSEECPIRFIITVNALKEGWDCPFAYILASLANRTSQVDVEQIVGRVLRQPHTYRFKKNPSLNMSYVLTSSNDFKNTLDGIVKGLNGAGFSEKDYRIGEIVEPKKDDVVIGQQANIFEQPIPSSETETKGEAEPELPKETEEFLEFDAGEVTTALKDREKKEEQEEEKSGAEQLLQEATKQQESFEEMVANEGDQPFSDLPTEVRDMVDSFHINIEFEGEVKALKLPQFQMKVENSLFVEGYTVKLSKEHLSEGFSLRGKPYDIDFDRADDEIARVDINDTEGSVPKVFKMSGADQRFFKEQFSHYTSEKKKETCKDSLYNVLKKMDAVEDADLKNYISLIVDNMDAEVMGAYEKAPMGFAHRIKAYIEALLEEHYQKCFSDWVEIEKIVCEPSYEFPTAIAPIRSTSTFGGSLYKAEEEVNGFEYDMVMALTGLENIKWWHRNIARRGFCINAYINHYPDFIVMTKTGKIVLIETKGDHLENTETKQKLAVGRAWQNLAGPMYKYYMVFQSKDLNIEGAYQFDKFLDILKNL